MQEVLTRKVAPNVTAQVIDSYYRWIGENKIDIHSGDGFNVDKADLHPSLFPHQVDTVQWMLARGKAMNASSFGLGKTRIACECLRQIHLRTGGKTLIVAPLGVRHQFVVKDGPAMGMRIQYVRTDAEAMAADTPYLITNYERVREGDISAQNLASSRMTSAMAPKLPMRESFMIARIWAFSQPPPKPSTMSLQPSS